MCHLVVTQLLQSFNLSCLSGLTFLVILILQLNCLIQLLLLIVKSSPHIFFSYYTLFKVIVKSIKKQNPFLKYSTPYFSYYDLCSALLQLMLYKVHYLLEILLERQEQVRQKCKFYLIIFRSLCIKLQTGVFIKPSSSCHSALIKALYKFAHFVTSTEKVWEN